MLYNWYISHSTMLRHFNVILNFLNNLETNIEKSQHDNDNDTIIIMHF